MATAEQHRRPNAGKQHMTPSVRRVEGCDQPEQHAPTVLAVLNRSAALLLELSAMTSEILRKFTRRQNALLCRSSCTLDCRVTALYGDNSRKQL